MKKSEHRAALRTLTIVFAAVLASSVLLAFFTVWVPEPAPTASVSENAVKAEPSFLSFEYWQEGGTNTSRSEVIRNLGLLAVGIVGLGFGIWRAYTAHRQTKASQKQADSANDQARIAEQGHFTDRFSKAVEQLGSETLPVRIGGIYALWRLAKDSPANDLVAVLDVLCAFVRNPIKDPVFEREAVVDSIESPLRPDVQAVIDLLFAPAADYREHVPRHYRISFVRADLRCADLTFADFKIGNLGGNLAFANLEHANLRSANLREVLLFGANLRNAALTNANLSGADFSFVEGLTQTELDATRANPDDPPVNLPKDADGNQLIWRGKPHPE